MSREWLLVLCAACGGSGDDAGADAAGGPPEVTITATTTFESPDGNVTQPTDLSTTTFYVLVGDSFTRFPSSGTVTGGTDGRARIPVTLSGDYLLVVNGNDFEPQTSRDVAWTTTRTGRPDAAVGGANTAVHLVASGMQPWGSTDWYEVTASANGAVLEPSNAADAATALPASGATTFDETFAWSLSTAASPQPTLFDPARGDTVTVAHYAGTVTDDGSIVQTLAETATIAPTTAQTSGATAMLDGAFTPLAATTAISFAIDLDAVDAALPSHLAMDLDNWSVAVTAGPSTHDGTVQGLTPIRFSGASLQGTSSSGLQHMPALDASWVPLVSGAAQLFGVYSVPGANPFSRYGQTYWQQPYAGGDIAFPADVPMATSATVNGLPILEQFVTWDEMSPVTIAITAPAGTDNHVNLSRIDGTTTQITAFIALGDRTSITLPGTLFAPGGYYMLEVGVATGGSTTQQGSWLPFGKFRIGAANKSFCGDGVVDAPLGEVCDDGGQGQCSDTCQ